jgi:hypothetical protein
LHGLPYDSGVRRVPPKLPWARWLNLAALVRVIALLVSVQIAAIAPAMASVAALVTDSAGDHCPCCKGNDGHADAAEADVVSVHATDEDCGGCPPGQPCTDCPAGCASCHGASSARLLLPTAFSIIASLSESSDGGAIAEQQSLGRSFPSSLDRPPKHALAI